jgi:hypothetical protein
VTGGNSLRSVPLTVKSIVTVLAVVDDVLLIEIAFTCLCVDDAGAEIISVVVAVVI